MNLTNRTDCVRLLFSQKFFLTEKFYWKVLLKTLGAKRELFATFSENPQNSLDRLDSVEQINQLIADR